MVKLIIDKSKYNNLYKLIIIYLFQFRQPRNYQVKILKTKPFSILSTFSKMLHSDVRLTLTHCHLVYNAFISHVHTCYIYIYIYIYYIYIYVYIIYSIYYFFFINISNLPIYLSIYIIFNTYIIKLYIITNL